MLRAKILLTMSLFYSLSALVWGVPYPIDPVGKVRKVGPIDPVEIDGVPQDVNQGTHPRAGDGYVVFYKKHESDQGWQHSAFFGSKGQADKFAKSILKNGKDSIAVPRLVDEQQWKTNPSAIIQKKENELDHRTWKWVNKEWVDDPFAGKKPDPSLEKFKKQFEKPSPPDSVIEELKKKYGLKKERDRVRPYRERELREEREARLAESRRILESQETPSSTPSPSLTPEPLIPNGWEAPGSFLIPKGWEDDATQAGGGAGGGGQEAGEVYIAFIDGTGVHGGTSREEAIASGRRLKDLNPSSSIVVMGPFSGGARPIDAAITEAKIKGGPVIFSE